MLSLDTWLNDETIDQGNNIYFHCKGYEYYLNAGEYTMDPECNVTIVFIVRYINVHHNLNWHLINIRNVWLEILFGLIGMHMHAA